LVTTHKNICKSPHSKPWITCTVASRLEVCPRQKQGSGTRIRGSASPHSFSGAFIVCPIGRGSNLMWTSTLQQSASSLAWILNLRIANLVMSRWKTLWISTLPPRAHLGEENNYWVCHYVHHLLKTIQMNQNQNIQTSFAEHSLEFSVKSGKHGTRTLSLLQNRVRFKRHAKKYISLQWGWGGQTERCTTFCAKLQTEFHPVLTPSFRFPRRLHSCYIYFHCSHMYN
jgi:hypothetical protein